MAIKVFGVDNTEDIEIENGYFGDPGVERRIRLCAGTGIA